MPLQQPKAAPFPPPALVLVVEQAAFRVIATLLPPGVALSPPAPPPPDASVPTHPLGAWHYFLLDLQQPLAPPKVSPCPPDRIGQLPSSQEVFECFSVA